ncbi:MAG: porin [Pseudomonadota bacterium]
MRKLVLAAAIAAATPAFAQSSVAIYGRLNVTVESVKQGEDDRRAEVRNNSSRIGFKGVEDLGGGLKAGFQIEHGFDPSTGQQNLNDDGSLAPFWGRQAEVNLSSAFGTVRLGTFTPESYYATADYISMHNHDTGDSADLFYTTRFTTQNKVGYASPNFGGLQVHASVSEGSASVERTYDVAANYDLGNWHFGAGYEKQGDFNQFAVRGLVELGSFTLGAYLQRVDHPTRGDALHARVSGMWAFGASELHLNVGRAGEYSNIDQSDAVQFTLGYNYNLSKRTKAYAYYTRVDRDDVLKVYGGDFDALAVGVRHNF